MAKFIGTARLAYLWNKIKAYANITTNNNVATINIGSSSITPLTEHQDISGKADKATTLAGYGITDAKIQNGTITLGSSTITPLTSYTESDPTVPAWAKASSKPSYTASEVGAVPTSQKGAANGVCPLDANTKIDSQYLPSYVDDVVEAYIRAGQTALGQNWLATGSASGTVITPQSGVIYVIMNGTDDYPTNSQYRWGGSAYVKLNDGGVSEMTEAEMDAATNNWS